MGNNFIQSLGEYPHRVLPFFVNRQSPDTLPVVGLDILRAAGMISTDVGVLSPAGRSGLLGSVGNENFLQRKQEILLCG